MKTNFEIEENCAVNLDGIYIDLHNNFDLVEIIEEPTETRIKFTRSKGEWVSVNEFKHLIFVHRNVSYTYGQESETNGFRKDSRTLNTLTFFPASDRENNDGFIDQAKSRLEDDIIYSFENGSIYRLHCQEIELFADK